MAGTGSRCSGECGLSEDAPLALSHVAFGVKRASLEPLHSCPDDPIGSANADSRLGLETIRSTGGNLPLLVLDLLQDGSDPPSLLDPSRSRLPVKIDLHLRAAGNFYPEPVLPNVPFGAPVPSSTRCLPFCQYPNNFIRNAPPTEKPWQPRFTNGHVARDKRSINRCDGLGHKLFAMGSSFSHYALNPDFEIN